MQRPRRRRVVGSANRSIPGRMGRSPWSCWSAERGSATPRCAASAGSRARADHRGALSHGAVRRAGTPTTRLSSGLAQEPTMTSEAAFDPTAPLAGPPEPWESTSTPSTRLGPPYHMTDMIAAEPYLARRIVERLAPPDSSAARLAAEIRTTLEAGNPVILTGCGTSEHAALAAAEILREAAHAADFPNAVVAAEQAFELSLSPPTRGLVIGISHEGGTTATNAAIRAARDPGRSAAVITVSRRSPAGPLAEIVVETEELDHGWCHTVGYLSPIVAAAAVGAHLSGRALDPAGVADLIADGTRDTAGGERIAARFSDAVHLLVIASGADRPAGRELVLKVEEAAWLPS